ncbi:uncharacterized protein C8Q71DRAFT_740097 [Rhodofomes roseus]|uniref:Uncharacterized protein n=1 Tax=Rhodofomes roseus TaxID=34475 RepID=A0ABQ8KPZ6_9APHY|nr:uncharacterized protein C8Q71DRAFT_740097 [Rhodofomes roseus]KAH9840575.1 hypothetical protein C8Q71DRAFT_740097 [Rhodofomes roseus]
MSITHSEAFSLPRPRSTARWSIEPPACNVLHLKRQCGLGTLVVPCQASLSPHATVAVMKLQRTRHASTGHHLRVKVTSFHMSVRRADASRPGRGSCLFGCRRHPADVVRFLPEPSRSSRKHQYCPIPDPNVGYWLVAGNSSTEALEHPPSWFFVFAVILAITLWLVLCPTWS